jgi:hypothetical protein
MAAVKGGAGRTRKDGRKGRRLDDTDRPVSRTETHPEMVADDAGLCPAEREAIRAASAERSIPSRIEDLIQGFITRKTGKAWDDPAVLDRIRRAVVAQKAEYWKDGERRRVEYTAGYSVLAYLAYHAPVYLAESRHLIASLLADGLLSRCATIIDAGSGPGVVSLAALDLYTRLGTRNLTLAAIERAPEQAEAYRFLTGGFSEGIPGVTILPPVCSDLRDLDEDTLLAGADLVVLQNVLNEMRGVSPENRAGLVSRLASPLLPKKTILIAEPAEMASSVAMRNTVRRLLADGFVMHRPCSFLWGSRCSNDRCWSFVSHERIEPTRLQSALAARGEAFRFVNTDLKYSFAILRKPPVDAPMIPRLPQGFVKFSSLQRRVGRVIDAAAAVMSGDLGDQKHHVFLVCDGTARKPVYAILPRFNISTQNRMILRAGYGDVLGLYRVKVRYNPAHDAFNLLLGRDTVLTCYGGSGAPVCRNRGTARSSGSDERL